MTIYSIDVLLFCPVCCSMSSSNCCFLICIQISQEAGKVVWYSHLFKNFSHFVVIYTVKGFGIVNKPDVDVFLQLSCVFNDPTDAGIWSLVPLPFLNRIWTSESVHILLNISVHVLLKPSLENFEHYFSSMWNECNCAVSWIRKPGEAFSFIMFMLSQSSF